MFTTKRLGAIVFPLCSILFATTARAETPVEDVAPATTTAPADGVRAPLMVKAANDTIASGLFVLLSGYVMNIAVSLSADQTCQGPTCSERYLSFVPLVGGALQFATAGKAFHEQHHGDNCYPLTLADVTGQAVGVVGVATGLVMRYIAHKNPGSHAGSLEVTGTVDHGAGVGLSVSLP